MGSVLPVPLSEEVTPSETHSKRCSWRWQLSNKRRNWTSSGAPVAGSANEARSPPAAIANVACCQNVLQLQLCLGADTYTAMQLHACAPMAIK